MTVSVETIGQSLLNSELYNGLAAKDSELLTAKLASISANFGPSADKKLEAERNRLRKELQENNKTNQMLAADLRAERAKSEALATTVAEKEALVVEWMHSNESFKRLARQYGKKVGLSDVQRLTDLNNTLAEVAEENPAYKNTKIGKDARADLNAKAPSA